MYITNLEKQDGYYTALIQKAINEGKEYFLRHEISVDFKIEKGKFQLKSGWFIGAEDMVLGPEDEEIIEYHFPGLIEQLVKEAA